MVWLLDQNPANGDAVTAKTSAQFSSLASETGLPWNETVAIGIHPVD
jgi:hypothetical protein